MKEKTAVGLYVQIILARTGINVYNKYGHGGGILRIDELKALCEAGQFKWTTHIMMRLQERNINPSDVRNCILTGEVIEDYPDDYPYPSCLVLGASVAGKMLHVVMGHGEGFLWLITAYYPSEDKWQPDFKHRKES